MNDKLLDELDGLQALLFARAHGSSLYEETLREWGLRSANYWADIRAHITELEARNRKLERVVERYAFHDRDCILARQTAGRATEDGGYEVRYRDKWYQVRPVDESPDCECGFHAALEALEDGE